MLKPHIRVIRFPKINQTCFEKILGYVFTVSINKIFGRIGFI